MAEDQPRWTGRGGRHALVQEGAERRHTGARTNHDDRRVAGFGQAEIVRLLHVDEDLTFGTYATAEEGRGNAQPLAAQRLVHHRINSEADPAAVGLGRG